LQHVIRVRQQLCVFPGCGRAARRCDLDHTIPYHRGGRTCECNVAPLCRKHHQAKQARGWRLDQPQPGIMIWTTPSGRRYTTRQASYPS
jgi:HNH endonuclease